MGRVDFHVNARFKFNVLYQFDIIREMRVKDSSRPKRVYVLMKVSTLPDKRDLLSRGLSRIFGGLPDELMLM